MSQPRGSFNIPRKPGSNTNGARAAYREAFGREWNGDDAYLWELAAEAAGPRVFGSRYNCADFVQWMRENDDLSDEPARPSVAGNELAQ